MNNLNINSIQNSLLKRANKKCCELLDKETREREKNVTLMKCQTNHNHK